MHELPRLPDLDASILDATFKGYPGTAPPMRLDAVRKRRWNVLAGDLPLPVAVIKASSLAHNRVWMKRFLAASGTLLCPHGKTTMSPQLFAAQLEDGAFGLTCATVSQLQVYRRFGIRRILMANQLIGAAAIGYVVGELARDPAFELYLLVDSVAGVDALARGAAAAGLGRPLRLLLEVGSSGARTGARSMAAVESVIAAIEARRPLLELNGVESFEGVFEGSAAERERAVEALLAFQLEVSRRAQASPSATRTEPWILSAGGSAFFDLAAARLAADARASGAVVVLRSGCYLTHDHTAYAGAERARRARSVLVDGLGEGFRPALEVWAHVQSRPEPERAYLTAGKRDLSYDLDLPQPIAWLRPGTHAAPRSLGPDHRVFRLNDQHAHLAIAAESPLNVGDLVALGISHPCTTFDKWQLIYLVDDDYTVIDAIRTFF